MPRIQGLKETGLQSADLLLKTGEGYVFSVTIGFKGVTAGELFTLKDGVTVTAENEVVLVFSGANGTLTKEWPQGKLFETGIFANVGATAGNVWYEVTYK
jgi:hypothetical protein